MDIGEAIKVYVRIRPRWENLPKSSLGSVVYGGDFHNGNCATVEDSQNVRITPCYTCHCEACMQKNMMNVKIEVFGTRKTQDKLFKFDQVFAEHSSQADIYENVKDIVKSTVLGYNATIFAYGATGSGKTYTMNGTPSQPGIIPRAIEDIFRNINMIKERDTDSLFHVELSFVELHNNNFRNLLRAVPDMLAQNSKRSTTTTHAIDPSKDNESDVNKELDELLQAAMLGNPLFDTTFALFPTFLSDKIEIHESEKTGVFLAGPNLKIVVKNAEQAIKLVKIGNQFRAVAPIQCNDLSSRSHSILTFHVESRVITRSNRAYDDRAPEQVSGLSSRLALGEGGDHAELRLGKIHLVDLAGSERLNESKAEGETLVETQNINKSLLALGDVLHALSTNAVAIRKNQRIDYEKHASAAAAAASGAHNKTPSKTPNKDFVPINFNTPPSFTAPKGFQFTPLGNLTPMDSAANAPTPQKPTNIHIPYLNSKLTHLLKDSLGGNTKTVMIANVSPEMEHYHQSLYSLMYASRARKVRNVTLVNKIDIGEAGMLDVTSEANLINQLKSKLLEPAARNKYGVKIASKNTPVKALPPATKKLVLTLRSVRAKDLEYLFFPMSPFVKVKVGTFVVATNRQLYANLQASYSEVIAVEIEPDEFHNGIEVEVEVFVHPIAVDAVVPIGKGKVQVKAFLALNGEEASVVIPLTGSFMLNGAPVQAQRGEIVLLGSVCDAPPLIVQMPTESAVTPARNRFSSPGPMSPAVTPKQRTSSGSFFTPDKDWRNNAGSSSVVNGLRRLASATKNGFETPRTGADKVDKPGHLFIKRIVCSDLQSVAQSPDTKQNEMFAILQLGNEKRALEMVGQGGNADVSFDNKNSIKFEVDLTNLRWESLNIKLFDVHSNTYDKLVGEAYTSIHSLGPRRGELVEFPLRLKNSNYKSVGLVTVYLRLTRAMREMVGVVSHSKSLATPYRGMPSSPMRQLMLSPAAKTPSRSWQDASEVSLPESLASGWFVIQSIEAQNLNKFKLVGRRIRYNHMLYTETPTGHTQSEMLGLQDPFLTMELGSLWASHTKVLREQSCDCVWRDTDLRLFFSRDALIKHPLKVTVYDHNSEGGPDAFVGTAAFSLAHESALSRLKEDVQISARVTNRSGKYCGKLILNCSLRSEEGKWFTATINKVRGDGLYDVEYEDGDIEPRISKDVMLLADTSERSRHFTLPDGSKSTFSVDDRVSVNPDQKGIKWVPARVAGCPGERQYDIECRNGQVLQSLAEEFIRELEAGGAKVSHVAKFHVGECVEGNYKCKGKWYTARIRKHHRSDGSYDMYYDNGDVELHVEAERVRVPEIVSPARLKRGAVSMWSMGPDKGAGADSNEKGLKKTASFGRKEGVSDAEFTGRSPMKRAGSFKKEAPAEVASGLKKTGSFKQEGNLITPEKGLTSRTGSFRRDADDKGLKKTGSFSQPKESSSAAKKKPAVTVDVDDEDDDDDEVQPFSDLDLLTPLHSTKRPVEKATPVPRHESPTAASLQRTRSAAAVGRDSFGESGGLVRKAASFFEGKSPKSAAGSSGALKKTSSFSSNNGSVKNEASGGLKKTPSFTFGSDPKSLKRAESFRNNKYSQGQQVRVNYRKSGHWVLGKVWKVRGEQLYDLDYGNGDYETAVLEENLQPLQHTSYRVGDHVEANYRGIGKFVAGVVRRDRGHFEYDIDYVDGKLESRVSDQHMRLVRAAEMRESTHHLNDKVEVYFDIGVWRTGVVRTVHLEDVCTYDIEYSNGEFDDKVAEEFVRRVEVLASTPAAVKGRYQFEVGDKVEADYRELGKWYLGVIRKDRGNGVFDIDYNNGMLETKVSSEAIRLVQSVSSALKEAADLCAKLTEGSRVEANYQGQGVWYAGVIRKVRENGFDVCYDDGQCELEVKSVNIRPVGVRHSSLATLRPVFRVGDKVRLKSRSREVVEFQHALSAAKAATEEEAAMLAAAIEQVETEKRLLAAAKARIAEENASLQAYKAQMAKDARLMLEQAGMSDEDAEHRGLRIATAVVDKAIAMEESIGLIAANVRNKEEGKALTAAKAREVAEGKAAACSLSVSEQEELADAARSADIDDEVAALVAAKEQTEEESRHLSVATDKAIEELRALSAAICKAEDEAVAVHAAFLKAENAVRNNNELDAAIQRDRQEAELKARASAEKAKRLENMAVDYDCIYPSDFQPEDVVRVLDDDLDGIESLVEEGEFDYDNLYPETDPEPEDDEEEDEEEIEEEQAPQQRTALGEILLSGAFDTDDALEDMRCMAVEGVNPASAGTTKLISIPSAYNLNPRVYDPCSPKKAKPSDPSRLKNIHTFQAHGGEERRSADSHNYVQEELAVSGSKSAARDFEGKPQVNLRVRAEELERALADAKAAVEEEKAALDAAKDVSAAQSAAIDRAVQVGELSADEKSSVEAKAAALLAPREAQESLAAFYSTKCAAEESKAASASEETQSVLEQSKAAKIEGEWARGKELLDSVEGKVDQEILILNNAIAFVDQERKALATARALVNELSAAQKTLLDNRREAEEIAPPRTALGSLLFGGLDSQELADMRLPEHDVSNGTESVSSTGKRRVYNPAQLALQRSRPPVQTDKLKELHTCQAHGGEERRSADSHNYVQEELVVSGSKSAACDFEGKPQVNLRAGAEELEKALADAKAAVEEENQAVALEHANEASDNSLRAEVAKISLTDEEKATLESFASAREAQEAVVLGARERRVAAEDRASIAGNKVQALLEEAKAARSRGDVAGSALLLAEAQEFADQEREALSVALECAEEEKAALTAARELVAEETKAMQGILTAEREPVVVEPTRRTGLGSLLFGGLDSQELADMRLPEHDVSDGTESVSSTGKRRVYNPAQLALQRSRPPVQTDKLKELHTCQAHGGEERRSADSHNYVQEELVVSGSKSAACDFEGKGAMRALLLRQELEAAKQLIDAQNKTLDNQSEALEKAAALSGASNEQLLGAQADLLEVTIRVDDEMSSLYGEGRKEPFESRAALTNKQEQEAEAAVLGERRGVEQEKLDALTSASGALKQEVAAARASRVDAEKTAADAKETGDVEVELAALSVAALSAEEELDALKRSTAAAELETSATVSVTDIAAQELACTENAIGHGREVLRVLSEAKSFSPCHTALGAVLFSSAVDVESHADLLDPTSDSYSSRKVLSPKSTKKPVSEPVGADKLTQLGRASSVTSTNLFDDANGSNSLQDNSVAGTTLLDQFQVSVLPDSAKLELKSLGDLNAERAAKIFTPPEGATLVTATCPACFNGRVSYMPYRGVRSGHLFSESMRLSEKAQYQYVISSKTNSCATHEFDADWLHSETDLLRARAAPSLKSVTEAAQHSDQFEAIHLPTMVDTYVQHSRGGGGDTYMPHRRSESEHSLLGGLKTGTHHLYNVKSEGSSPSVSAAPTPSATPAATPASKVNLKVDTLYQTPFATSSLSTSPTTPPSTNSRYSLTRVRQLASFYDLGIASPVVKQVQMDGTPTKLVDSDIFQAFNAPPERRSVRLTSAGSSSSSNLDQK